MNKRTLVGVAVAATSLLAAAFPAGATTPEGPATQPLRSASVTPTSVEAGTGGSNFVLTYETGDRPFRGTVRTVIPAGWSVPQTADASAAGYLSLSLDTCRRGALGAVTGTGPWTVTVDGVTCRQTTSFTLRYGNVQVPTTAGPAELTTTSAFAGSPVFTGVEVQPVVTLRPGPARWLTVAGHPDRTTAGTAQPFTVTGVDQYGNTNAPVEGTVAFSSTDSRATLPAPSPVPGGSAAFTATLVTAGTQSITAARTGDGSVHGTQAGIVVAPAALASITLSPSSATVPAGVAQPYAAEGFDAYGNSRGTVTPTLSISPDGTCDAVSCTATTAGAHTVTGTVDGISDTADVTVVPDEVASLSVSGYPTTTTAGTPAGVTVTALDQYGNVVTDYDGTVAVTSSDPQAQLPADGALSDGVGTFSVELRTAGTHSITATDTAMLAVTGTQSGVNVAAGPLAHLHLDPPTASLKAGQSQTFTATGTDAYGNPVGSQSPVYSVSPTGTCVDSTCEFRRPGVQTVTGTVGSVTGTATVTVAENTVVVQPETIADAVDGEAYSAQFSATGTVGSAAFFDVYGELPPGLAMSSTGALTGTPNTVGVFTFDVRATDENGVRGIRRYTVRVIPAVVVDRGAVAYGDVAVTASETEVVTVTNQGSQPVVLGSRSTTNAGNFAAVDDTCFTVEPLAPGASCTSGVRFSPQTEAAHTGQIAWHFFRESDGRSFSARVNLSGAGVSPLVVDRTGIAYGDVPVTSSATEVVTVTNRGGAPMTLSSRSTSNASNFSAVDDTCFTAEPLAPGASCTSGVRFGPQATGAHLGEVAWHFAGDGGISASVRVNLSGAGVSPLVVDRTGIAYGDVPVTSSATEVVTVTNRGGAPMTLSSRSTSNASNFSAVDDTCFT
ncbi:MAG: choice-of-anchor D domain-containing protein, partial [Actinobacteria bacterium]|nr:choice-of-anchor D domain-containing protein [Actinomycetota bacterium]